MPHRHSGSAVYARRHGGTRRRCEHRRCLLHARYRGRGAAEATPTSPMYHAKASGQEPVTSPFSRKCRTMLQERLRSRGRISVVRSLTEEFFLGISTDNRTLAPKSLLGVESARCAGAPSGGGILMPGRFIQVAEECGQIVKARPLGVESRPAVTCVAWRRS